MTESLRYPIPDEILELTRTIPAIRDHFGKVAPMMEERLDEAEYSRWLAMVSTISRSAPRAWEAAVEFMRSSPDVLTIVPFATVIDWGQAGRELAARSADIGASYFRAGPACLRHVPQESIVTWAAIGARIYLNNWRSAHVAARFFEVSPQLTAHVALDDLDLLSDLIVHLEERAYHVAQECLTIAQTVLPRVDRHLRAPLLAAIRALANGSENAAKQVFEQANWALSRVERQEQHKFLVLGERMAWLNNNVAAAFFIEGAEYLDKLPRNLHALVLLKVEELLQYTPRAALEFVKTVPRLLERLKPEDLDDYVDEGISILRVNEDGGLAYFKLESQMAEEMIKTLSRGVELGRVGEVLQLYAKALTGVDVHIQPTEQIARKGIGWTSEKKPTTEGTNIFLPPFVQEYDTKAENFACLKLFATHQAGHLEFGSFRFRFDQEGPLFLTKRAELERQIGIQSTAISDMERLFDLFANRRMAGDIFTVAEDNRIDARLRGEYSGIRATMRRLQQDARSRRPATTQLPLRMAFVESLLQWSLDDRKEILLPQQMHGHFLTGVAYLRDLAQPVATVEDVAEVTVRIYALARGVPNAPASAVPREQWLPVQTESIAGQSVDDVVIRFFGKPDASVSELAALLQQPEAEGEADYEGVTDVDFRGDFKPELVQTLMRLKLKDTDSGMPIAPLSPEELKALFEKMSEGEISELVSADLDESSGLFVSNIMREAGQQATERDDSGPRRPKGDVEGDALEATAPQTFVYDEWDFRAGDYKPKWCLLTEKSVELGTNEFYEETLKKYAKLAEQVKRQFEMMRPELFKKIKNLTDGEEFDLDKVIEAAVDRKAGASPSEKLYWRRNKEERSVAMTFIVDMSASTEEDIDKVAARKAEQDSWINFDDDDPRAYVDFFRQSLDRRQQRKRERRRIIDLEKESTVLLIEALQTVGDAYGVYGFSGYGRDNVEFFVIKDLEENYSDLVKQRLEKVEPVRGTRMGPAIRHAITKLDAHAARVKVLILLSDGRPQDHNYGRDRTEKEYAIHDTKMALMEAKRHNIVPFCLTVDQTGHDYLKAMCEDMGYEVVEDIKELPSRLPTLYRMLTV